MDILIQGEDLKERQHFEYPLDIRGIEEKALYERIVHQVYATLDPLRDPACLLLTALKERIATLKKHRHDGDFQELDRFESDSEKLGFGPQELESYCDLLLKGIDMRFTPATYQCYLAHKEAFRVNEWIAFVEDRSKALIGDSKKKRGLPKWDNQVIDLVEEFYEICIQRAHTFADRALDHIENSRGNAGMLLIGGFHTHTVTRLLQKRGVFYVVIDPRITAAGQMGVLDKAIRRQIKERCDS
jgi:hypothetical protein